MQGVETARFRRAVVPSLSLLARELGPVQWPVTASDFQRCLELYQGHRAGVLPLSIVPLVFLRSERFRTCAASPLEARSSETGCPTPPDLPGSGNNRLR